MTKARIREIVRGMMPKGERIVDIYIYENMVDVDVITITKRHTVWLQHFRIVDNDLEYLYAKIAVFT